MSFPEHSTNPCDPEKEPEVPGTVTGRIHSIETYGTVDGPGVRFVIFTQGCPMRCLYCHNPDTWNPGGGRVMTVDALLEQYERNRGYYRQGGITVSGGEPMMQMQFLTVLFEEAARRKIHTCLDTSGICFREGDPSFMKWLERLIRVTDLVMLDIKHIEDKVHRELTKHSNEPVLAFARYLDQHGVTMWIRHVIVEGYTVDEKELQALGSFIGGLRHVKGLDVLPYHSMGKQKYESMGIEYPLKELPDLPKEKAVWAKEEILRGIRKMRMQRK